ncbi:hypothetical protein LTS18_014197 [Coniosporium uncinatum]|uniref:Uncharacterized protein n=1 Tax=Coniosporium uncinatum TaxID=93489 RepID=A0ACC3DD10_9PEZI|nr:hypothetical protein LTS18_014197 [Coniosporium uncinatum]
MASTELASRSSGNDTDTDTEIFKPKILSFASGLHGVNQDLNYVFVHAFVGVLIIACVLTLGLRLMRRFSNYLRRISTQTNSQQQFFWSMNQTRWWPALKQHLLYAPFWRHRHNREFQLSDAISMGTLPSRFHTLMLLILVGTNLTYILVLPWYQAQPEIIAELRARSGVMAVINLIPTMLFAMRNNPLIPLLQISYDTFNLLHRWAARVVIVDSLIHVFAWGANTYREGKMQAISTSLANTPSYTWGLVATVCFAFIFLQAWGPIRHAFYETFLNAHRLLALFGVIGIYVHIDTHHLPQLFWIIIVILIWVGEYIFRFAWVLYYNISLLPGQQSKRLTRITVEALPSQACRVTLALVRPWGWPRPGCHVHVYMPTLSLWASHPFSVAWTETKMPQSSSLPVTEETKRMTVADLDLREDKQTTVSLVVRARTGFTRKLYDRASSSASGVYTTWGAIEGPYGGWDSLQSYGTVLMFAGGVGITHQVGFVRQLVEGAHEGTVSARKIILVWSVPNTEALEWVRPWMDEILKIPGRREVLKILLFVTKPRSHNEVISGTGTVQMFPGRCNPQTILDRELVDRVGAMAVTVCGPGAFADSVRAAARRRVGKGVLDFIEEAFTY